MRRYSRIKTFAIGFFIFLYALPVTAQESYRLLQPLTGPSMSVFQVNDLGVYLNVIFSVILGIIGILAVIKIILGGLQYMSTDAISGKEDGKHMIQSAVGGLLLAIIAWIILNTINPDLLKILDL
ncbi:MAG: hypothetical protein KAR00_03595 [Candidatus Pacebacteria bacterium]|nr:hypothetical protein [Candidatus Paceibacterota bacterium]